LRRDRGERDAAGGDSAPRGAAGERRGAPGLTEGPPSTRAAHRGESPARPLELRGGRAPRPDVRAGARRHRRRLQSARLLRHAAGARRVSPRRGRGAARAEINPASAEAMTSLAYGVTWFDRNLAEAERLFRKAIDIN